jgi:hypothetical protein
MRPAPAIAVAIIVLTGSCDCLAQATAKEPRCFAIELYVRRSEALSREVEKGLSQWASGAAGVRLKTFDLDADPASAKRLSAITSYFRLGEPPLPLIYGCGQYLAGYRDATSFVVNVASLLRMDVYVRSGCTRCAAAKAYLPSLQARYPGLELRYFDIGSDAAAASQMQRLVDRYRQAAVSVPVFHFCNQLVVGFDGDSTGRRLEAALDRWSFACPPTKPKAEGPRSDDGWRPRKTSSRHLTPARLVHARLNDVEPVNAGTPGDMSLSDPPLQSAQADGTQSPGNDLDDLPLPGELPLPGDEPLGDDDSVEVPWLGRLSASRLGLPLFTIALGLVDGFNPCAMWVLLFLLSVLVNLRSRAKILAVAGTFVVISGMAYFAFMAAWLNVLVFVGLLRWVQVTLAVLAISVGAIHVKDFFALKKGISLSIPESAKPGIYARVRRIVLAENLVGAIIGAVVLAVLVNIIELLCTAGLPAVYTQVLTMQQLSAWQNYAYLLLYNVAYMFDDSLMVTVVTLTLGRRKMQEWHGRWLKLVSGLVILSLGAVMLLRPDWLV